MNKRYESVDEYLADLPEPERETLEGLRRMIRAAAPEATESISYGMPAFKYKGRPLVYLGATRSHCAIYGPAVAALSEELRGYDTSKGTLRFPPGSPPPAELLAKLVTKRIEAIDQARRSTRRG